MSFSSNEKQENLIEDNSIGVDTEADLKQVRNFFKK